MHVIELDRLPFEGPELMERLDLDPLDVFHRRDEPGNPATFAGSSVGIDVGQWQFPSASSCKRSSLFRPKCHTLLIIGQVMERHD
jgi:hypothetical protein